MKLTIYIWVMSFLIGVGVGCGRYPDTIKKDEDFKAKCQADCKAVGSEMNEFGSGFESTCKCK